MSTVSIVLYWSVMINKCQGLTLLETCVDMSPVTYNKGQAYVAFSRVNTLENYIQLIIQENRSKFLTQPMLKLVVTISCAPTSIFNTQ